MYKPDSAMITHRLNNGFTIALEPISYVHSASFGIWIKTGSAAETYEEAGLAHFLEHLFFKGTKTQSIHEIMDAIERRGGYLNASTSREYTTLYARMLEEHVSVGIDVLFDLLQNALFAEIEKERGVILEEIAAIEDTPDDFIHDLLSEFHWPDHPLGRPISGYSKTVSAFTYEDFRRFYSAWYTPANMVFSIAGKFDPDKVLAQIEKIMSPVKAQDPPTMMGTPRFQSGVQAVHRPISQSHINIAFPGSSSTCEDRFSCSVLTGILGGGSTSRLFERIREDEGLAYNVYAYHTSHVSTGMLGIYEAVAPVNCDRALALTFEELNRIREESVKIDELESARQQLKGSMLMAFEGSHARMAHMGKDLLFKGSVTPVDEIVARVDAVTVDGILEYAQSRFQKDSCAMIVLGPEPDKVSKEIRL
ncbi:MAG: insulinase family protein [Candidatus Hydrogenedentes bacterium]|nr:insulinase family protein [Candidatus Hydrogenedentota bacterium]